MKVLFKKDNKIGEVNDNYALNYLIPKGLAIKVTDKMQKEIAEKEEEKKEDNEKMKIEQSRIVKR
jgi:ribosomal protein L9